MDKKNIALVVLLGAVLVFTGCETMGPREQSGTVAGGLLGATAGGIIGHQSGRGLEGAAIGGVLGAIGGAIVGSSMDEMDRRALATNPEHITIIKIAEMGRQGVPGSVIIGEIQRTHSVYHLNSETINYLKDNNVDDSVIDYMLLTAG